MYLAKVFIQLKPTVSDPQGQTIHGGLRQLGFDSVESVRAGKYMEIRLDEDDEESAGRKLRDMCEKLLANPIIEDYTFDLEQISPA
ncbi:MAG: phosphoribosylformylglycinamidine synthase subunit PurS [Chloroflexi bacterium]|nr:phosphoribosylformylglycinamidine synthase subunit PurS [Chloroflexota bacterium]